MPLNASALSSAIQSAAAASGKMSADSGTLAAFADAIATSVIDHIKNNMQITVPPALLISTPAAIGAPVTSPVAPTPLPPGSVT
jgi:hypothetical protein